MNPLYGAGVERARNTGEGEPENAPPRATAGPEFSDGVYRDGPFPVDASDEIQLDSAEQEQDRGHHPAPVRSHQRSHMPSTPAQTANSIYNETSGLRPVTKRGSGSADDLSKARSYVAPIVKAGKFPVASDKLSAAAARAIKSYPPARAAYQDSLDAAYAAFSGHDPTGGATHFYLNYGQKPPSWAAGKKPVATFGPFKNVAGGGDVRKGAMVTIVIIR